DALLLAAAERCESSRFERGSAGGGERIPGDGDVIDPFELEPTEVRIAPHEHDLERGEIKCGVGLLRYDRDPPSEIAPRQRSDICSVDRDAPPGRRESA